MLMNNQDKQTIIILGLRAVKTNFDNSVRLSARRSKSIYAPSVRLFILGGSSLSPPSDCVSSNSKLAIAYLTPCL